MSKVKLIKISDIPAELKKPGQRYIQQALADAVPPNGDGRKFSATSLSSFLRQRYPYVNTKNIRRVEAGLGVLLGGKWKVTK